MPVVVVLLSVVLMFFMALASAVQRTLRALDLRRTRESDMSVETRAQILILLGICLRWLNAAFLLAVSLYVITARASAWYYGVAIIALCWIGSLLIGGTSRLQPGSAEMVALLVAELKRRREWYRTSHNTAYLSAVEDLLTRVRSFPRANTARGLHR